MKKKAVVLVVVIITLLIAFPLTRSILRRQLMPKDVIALLCHFIIPRHSHSYNPASVQSGDYLAQLAQAMEYPIDEDLSEYQEEPHQRASLRKLISRYPNRPEGYSGLLTRERNDYNIYPENTAPQNARKNAAFIQQTKDFLTDTENAIKIDPANGYFLTDQADALMCLGRNDEALECLKRIPSCPKFDSYANALYFGKIENGKQTQGWVSALDSYNDWRMSYAQAGVSAPYQELQIAIDKEHAGDIEQGFQIRKIIRNYAYNLLKHSQRIQTAQTAIRYLGFSFSSSLPHSTSGNKQDLWTTDGYADFLCSHGKNAEAAEIDQAQTYQRNVQAQLTQLLYAVYQKQGDCISTQSMRDGTVEYLLETVLIDAALATALLGLLFALMKWTNATEKRHPWPIHLLSHLISTPGLPLVFILYIFITFGTDMSSANDLFTKTLPNCLLARSSIYQKWGGVYFYNIISNHQFDLIYIQIWIQAIIAIAALIIAIRRKKGVYVAFISSLASSSLVLVVFYLCVYLAILPSMIKNNEMANKHISQDMTHETQYAAQLARIAWPPVEESK
jgi:hypothetical protein